MLIDLSNATDMQCENLSRLITDGVTSGEVQPLPTTIYKADAIIDAIQFMGQSRHIGKVVITMDNMKITPFPIKPQFYTHGTHLITGGLGGFGMELALWLAECGAEGLILSSRRGLRTGRQRLMLHRIEQLVKVEILTESDVDITNRESVMGLVQKIQPTGIWHLAMVLHDSTLQNMTEEQWKGCVEPKAAIQNLSEAAVKYGNKVEIFVGFSSVVNLYGHFGQANYAFANGIVEAEVHERYLNGSKNASGELIQWKCVRWGAVDDVGAVIDRDDDINFFEYVPVPIAECLEQLHKIMCSEGWCFLSCKQKIGAEAPSKPCPKRYSKYCSLMIQSPTKH